MRLVRPVLALLAVAVAVLLPASLASALSYPVTNLNNSGAGSLRGSIEEANVHPGFDTIPIGVSGTIGLGGTLGITGDVAITGPGADSLTIERGVPSSFRIFEISGGPDVTMSDLTVSGGREITAAGILNTGGELTLTRVVVSDNEAIIDGGGVNVTTAGGILSIGPLTLRESFIHDNRAIALGATERNVAAGGGIEATAELTIERSTISGNRAEAIGGGDSEAEAEGGGLLATGALTIKESTISGNSAEALEGEVVSVAKGGGIQANGLALLGSTVARNSAATDGAGAAIEFAAGSNLQVGPNGKPRNSIIAEPLGDSTSCAVPSGGSLDLDSGGFNLDEDGSCGLDLSTDIVGLPAGLGPLAFNGGPTPTHALLEGSLAIDRGYSFGSVLDQRGQTRPVDLPARSNSEGGDGADIGAFEVQLPPAASPAGTPIVVTQHPTDDSPPNTRILSGPPRSTFKTRAKFRFASSEPQSHFQCKLDKKKWKACSNPFKAKVKPGKHLFKVRAIDRFGNADPTPARFGWRVKRIVG